ncbi:DUF6059 family protein [Streptomyces sp. NPDC017958]|uniref:DUF6059 family protein n=1 Tax=Streptomyces sp. NPDC017958 TaxID=3365021 RepID=UPI0037A6334B
MIWLGLVSYGTFWTGPLPKDPHGHDRTAHVLPTGHPERLVSRALTRQERILARELGWTR